MRTFGVEEELLLVDAATLQPVAAADRLLSPPPLDGPTGHELTYEFKQQQIEVTSPPQTSFAGQLAAIRAGRAWADAAAGRAGARVVALPTAPGPFHPELVDTPRYRNIGAAFGLTAVEQFTCAFHVHVLIESREEGVAVLDRIRVWMPVLLALSANSPFWNGTDTGFASYRYQAWNRWPLTGPTDLFGTLSKYEQHRSALLASEVPLDPGMVYFDARLCEHQPTLEVRVADVCLEAEQAAAIATIVRALVETAARSWQDGDPAPGVETSVLRAWSWQASRHGLDDQLIRPSSGRPVPAGEVVESLLETISPVLNEYEEMEPVAAVLNDLLDGGSGARRQREAFSASGDLRDVVSDALTITHRS